jgi:hypothetical protein
MKNAKHFSMIKPAGTSEPARTVNAPETRQEEGSSENEISKAAYSIYLARGCPQGQDRQHWFEAEAQVIARGNLSRAHTTA